MQADVIYAFNKCNKDFENRACKLYLQQAIKKESLQNHLHKIN